MSAIDNIKAEFKCSLCLGAAGQDSRFYSIECSTSPQLVRHFFCHSCITDYLLYNKSFSTEGEIISDTQRDFLSQRYPGSIIPYILPKERSLLPKTYKFSGITPPKYKDPYDNHVLGVCPICRKKVDFTASVRRELWLERLNSLLCSCKVCSATGSHREMTHHLSQHVLELYNPDKSKDKQLIPTSQSSFSSFFPPAPHFSTFISVGSSVCISLRPHLILSDVSSH
ncbi:hypothetical protein ADUPG1_000479, partial [Aduncisulcus paluster]